MSDSRWVLSSGTELPSPDVPIYLPLDGLKGKLPAPEFRYERPTPELAQRALDIYRWAEANAFALLDDANVLASQGRFARAFALASTALEEIGKSQYAADVCTGFLPPDGFDKNIRDHRLKSAYASRYVELGSLVQPLLKDKGVARELFARRNDALYVSAVNEIDNSAFENDATTMIDYCGTWLERIRCQEEIAERIGTKAFLK